MNFFCKDDNARLNKHVLTALITKIVLISS